MRGSDQTYHQKQPLLSEISRRRKLSLLGSLLNGKKKILEVGSGDGWFTRRLRAQGHEVVALDLNGQADIVGDITNWRMLGLNRSSFDVVIALEVIEHVDCLDALTSLCRPHGIIFLSSPHPDWDWALAFLERVALLQKRTSVHCNLVDFSKLPLAPLTIKRPLWMHQVGVFSNIPKPIPRY
jgi:2-polyprenyl-3-methyl-5-hydroxy-6-metoxy-1,4-benzoquinol methylase